MKQKLLLVTSIVFFLIVNTAYFWKGKLGIWAMPGMLFLFLAFIVLGILFLLQVIFSIKEKFKSRSRLILICIMSVVVGLTLYKPSGLIDFDKLSGDDLLVANREGAANCMTTIQLKDNGEFREQNVCFGVTDINGNYEIKNDTIFFKNVNLGRDQSEYYKFAIIKHWKSKNDKEGNDLVRYKTLKDTIGQSLWITKNELKK